jgi:hypothetical protein
MQSLAFRTALGCSFTLILLAATASAAISPEQRKEAEALKADVDKAGRLFQMEKFKEAGELLRDVQARVDKFAETADAQAIKLLDPVMVRLKRAHGLLELEGVELAPIKDLEPGVKPAAKPDPKKPVTPPAAGETSFVAEIAPILVTRCGNCHVKEARGRFSMANYATLMKGPAEGVVIFPGEPVGSRLIEVIESGDMPRGGGKVAPAEYALLQKWIKEGAKFDGKDPMANLAALSPDAKAEEPKMLEVVAATGKETVSFAKDIAPILAGTCYNCHGGGQQTRANFNLVTFAGLLKGGDSAAPIVPGKGAESLLIKKLRGTAEGNRMPQNLPALADNVIAKIEKWIDEGAKYDGGDPAMNVRQVAALAKANASTHEELLAERKILAGEKWRLALPDIASAEIESKNFLVVGNVSKERLTAVSEAAEAVAPKVGTLLKAPATAPLIKGRMTLYVFDKLYDYDEFGNMVEKRDVPKTMRGHFSASPVEVYGAILPSKEDEYSLEALVGQQIAGAVVANLGKGTPKWYSEGAARAIADKLASSDPRVAAWDAELPRVLASMRSSDAFLTGQLNPEDADIANYSFVRWLMNDSRKFERLLTALRQGQDFTQSFTAVYGGSPAQLTVAWSAKGAITKRK